MPRRILGTTAAVVDSSFVTTTAMSYCAWLRNPSGTLPRVFDNGLISWFVNGANLEMQRQTTGTVATWTIPMSIIPSTRWFHLAWSDDGVSTSPLMAVNGERVTVTVASSPTGSRQTGASAMYYGNRAAGSRSWGGAQAYVSVHTAALTLSEIREHMQRGYTSRGLYRLLAMRGGYEFDYGPYMAQVSVTDAVTETGDEPINPGWPFAPARRRRGAANTSQAAQVDETGLGADAVAALRASTLVESGAGTDGATAASAATLAESGAGGDAAGAALLTTLAETASGADAAASASAGVLADAGAGLDAIAALYLATLADQGLGVDAATGYTPTAPGVPPGNATLTPRPITAALLDRAPIAALTPQDAPSATLRPRAPSATLQAQRPPAGALAALPGPAAALAARSPRATLASRSPVATLTPIV
jgi:hypothetical protein